MAVNLSPVGGVAAQFFTNTGAVLTGGKLYTYAAGTTTPATTFTASNGGTPWTNPIVLDAAGRVSGSGEIWLTDGINYKFVLKDSNDVLIATYDNVSGINSNFIAFTNQQQIITATANQTVFNLSINYQPGTNSLSVFVDGVNQYGPGAQYAYTETDSDTVTFVSGLHVGAEVKFTTSQQQGAGVTNASQVTYNPAGTGAVATNVQAKLRQYVSVQDFGADPTGVISSVTAFNNAVANGGTVYVPTGTYKLDNKVTLSVDGTTLFLGADVTLNLSGVAALQSPFGDQIHITANNCAVIGSGPSSLLQMTGGSQANAIGLLHASLLTIRDLTIDGDKTAVAPFVFDAFGSAITVVCDTGSGATSDARATIDNVYMKNFYHYGVNIYGNLANGIKIVNCNIESMGVNADPVSTGAGIVSTVGPSDLTIANNVVKNCKWSGVLITGGEDMATIAIANNLLHQNGYLGNGDGILLIQESVYGSVVGKGIFNVAITGNVCTGNARSGVNLKVDTVGYIKYITITGNTLEGNTFAGLEITATNTSPSIVSDVMVSGNLVVDNTTHQIFTNAYVTNISGVEQSFTPVISGSTTAGVGTYTSRSGTYTVTNNIVYFQLECAWSAHTGTGNILISGFPYPAQNSEPQPTGWVWTTDLTITGQATFGLIGNTTSGPLGAVNNGAYSAVALDTAASIRINGFYFIN